MDKEKKIAVVTGGSRGIGLATAKILAANGYETYCFARTKPEEEIENVKFIQCDLTDLFDYEVKARMWLAEVGRVDLLVNNAGVGICGAAEGMTDEDVKKLFDLNIAAFDKTLRMMTPYIRMKRGRIINVSSFAAYTPLPFQAHYSATKAYVLAFSKALALELKPFEVYVTAMVFGDANTGFTAARKNSDAKKRVYGRYLDEYVKKIENDEKNGYTSEQCAEAIYKVITDENPPTVKVVGGKYKFYAFLRKILPERVVDAIVFKNYGDKKKLEKRKDEKARGFNPAYYD